MAAGERPQFEIPRALRALGLEGFPPLPNGVTVEELIVRDDEFGPVVRWAQREGLAMCLDASCAAFGAGATCTDDGSPAVALLVAPDADVSSLPEQIEYEGTTYRVRLFRVPRTFMFTQRFVRQTGARAGSATGNANALGQGGTLSGMFPGPGSLPWAATCTHVALGWGFDQFLANLPASLLWLFDSPENEELIVSSGIQIGQGLVQLAEIDTSVRVLQPLPLALVAGTILAIYVDVAAGPADVRPFRSVPLFVPPTPPALPITVRETVQLTLFGPSRNARPGEPVYAYGQRLGLRWGEVAIVGLTLPLPVPFPTPLPIVVIFQLDVYDMRIAPGDSGMTAIALNDNRALAICGLGLGGTLANPINQLTLGTPRTIIRRFVRQIDF